MPQLACPSCNRDVSMHQLDTKTVAQRTGFRTTLRCPFCRADFDDVSELMA